MIEITREEIEKRHMSHIIRVLPKDMVLLDREGWEQEQWNQKQIYEEYKLLFAKMDDFIKTELKLDAVREHIKKFPICEDCFNYGKLMEDCWKSRYELGNCPKDKYNEKLVRLLEAE